MYICRTHLKKSLIRLFILPSFHRQPLLFCLSAWVVSERVINLLTFTDSFFSSDIIVLVVVDSLTRLLDCVREHER